MGWKVAPAGTVTVNAVVVAAVTFAFTDPINTMLLDGVALKLVPVMVTEVPTGPDAGENELIVGCARLFNEIQKTNKKRIKPFCRSLVGIAVNMFIECGNN